MLILPAIDIRGGRCVRLFQGDYARETVFGDDPAAMAERWLAEGAQALHLVDLDGARDGASTNRAAVLAILARAKACGRPIVTELGGGIRDLAGVESWLEAGLSRAVIGTAAVTNPELVSEAARRFPARVWVGIDARGGKVAVKGWLENTAIDAIVLARDMQSRGAAGIIFTDIDRDGTGHGVAAESTARLAEALSIPVVASGGVDSLDDVSRLRAVAHCGVEGVIVGRALYDGKVRLSDLLATAGAEPSDTREKF
ncbi:MAG: 1-(5-phosphoribosyl)-5-[(5-phosphoribosylamino)methylideneamino]imidazole-4-carboxamide isomerase [Deltaproteobacteria bacterium]|nr:1-(5-phosphoribosyl)-5-[(5-phosphoribosylamino)methylideneamino]imidazole-4-carboxamide isomerase [Deltaproteobacteria bacterium]